MASLRITKRTHAHQKFYEWALRNLSNPTYTGSIIDRYNATVTDEDDRITTGDLSNMTNKKLNSRGAAWPLLYRPAFGVYQTTTEMRLDDHSTLFAAATPAPSPAPAPAVSQWTGHLNGTGIYGGFTERERLAMKGRQP